VYLLGEIDAGGYIYVTQGANRKVLHRETRNLHYEFPTCETLGEAREKRERPGLVPLGLPLIVKLAKHGGAERLYGRKEDLDEVTERLQVWKGCYGAWPLLLFC